MSNTPNPQANTPDEILLNIYKEVADLHYNEGAFDSPDIEAKEWLDSNPEHKIQIEALIKEARIEGGQVSINTEIPKKITGFESMPAMGICRNLTIQDAKINEIIDYLSQLTLKENK